MHDSPKPASIKVFGILDIVFGTIGMVFGGFGILFYLLITQFSEFAYEFEKALSTQYAEGYVSLIQIGACFSLILSLILIASGVGLLKEKNWGRSGSLSYAVFQILYTVASTAVSISMMKHTESFTFTVGGSMCGVVIALIYPVCILIFLTHPTIVEALKD
ncbi:MAG: hypothetical protein VX392_05985 [Verrucomicrobiota bacterium]|nr:hypothetical protein [Verrucomicrobiota bacterium]